jgi:hypothetical protein
MERSMAASAGYSVGSSLNYSQAAELPAMLTSTLPLAWVFRWVTSLQGIRLAGDRQNHILVTGAGNVVVRKLADPAGAPLAGATVIGTAGSALRQLRQISQRSHVLNWVGPIAVQVKELTV